MPRVGLPSLGEWVDLERLVGQLRKLSIERAEIPAHSGTADSDTRRQRRARRAQLRRSIRDVEGRIVAWALAAIPPERCSCGSDACSECTDAPAFKDPDHV